MPYELTLALIAALGFVLGYFYTRTMRLTEKIPAEYVRREECKTDRNECRRVVERDRTELIRRVVRIETKLDRLIERLMEG